MKLTWVKAMEIRLASYLLNDDWSFQTEPVNGEIILDRDAYYSYDEMKALVDESVRINKRQYGWEIYYSENGVNKYLFLRDHHGITVNQTTSGKETIYEWVNYIYGNQIEQITLF